MKLKLKLATVAAAVATAFAAPAHALVAGANNNGSLFLAVWDTAVGGTYSFVQDLGFQINSFLPSGVTVGTANGGPATGDKTPDTGLSLDFNVSSLLSSYTGSLSTLMWNVVAADSSAQNLTLNSRRLVTTVVQGTTGAGTMTNTGLTTVTSNVGNTATFYNGQGCTPGSNAGNNCFSNDTSLGWAGGATFGATLGNPNLSTAGGIGDTLNMLYVAQTGTNPGSSSLVSSQLFSNLSGLSTWRLSVSGLNALLEYDVAAAAVPLPAAAWLFLSGLIGLVTISRRRKLAIA